MRCKAAAVLIFSAGTALAFQLLPSNNGCRQWRSVSGGKIKLLTPIYASSFADDSDVATSDTASAPSAAVSAFDEMLEKFALPLEFKDISSSRDGGKVDAAAAAADKVDEKVDSATSSKGAGDKPSSPSGTSSDGKEATASSEKSVTATTEPSSTAEIKVKKVDDRKEQADNEKVQSADAEAKVVQKVDDKKEQTAKEEVKVVQKADDKKETADAKKEQAVAPPNQEEAIPVPTAAFGPVVTPRRGFSDFGVTERTEPKIKWDFGEETKMKPTALGVNPNRKTEVVKMEEPSLQQQRSPDTKKEVDTSSVTESKAVSKASEIPAKDTTKSVATDEKISVLKPAPSSTEIAPSSTPSDLIQTQPLSLPSINLPESLRNVNMEDPGIIVGGVVLLGVTLYFAIVQNMNRVDNTADKGEEEEEPKPNLMQKVKDAGVAGAISYAFWELGFWTISIPICVVGYNKFTGHWPDLSNSEDMKQLGGEIFAFVNVARLAVPLRIGLALSTAPWVDENIVQRFKKDNNDAQQQVEMEEAALQEQTFVEEGEFVEEGVNGYGEMDMSMEDEGYLEWSGDEWQQEEMAYGDEVNEDDWQQGEMAYEGEGNEDFSQWSDFEERLSSIEADAMRVAAVLGPPKSEDANSERMASLPGNGYLNYIDEYCEPGTRSNNCAGAIKGYLDGLATTGAIASEREVTTIVGYLDSLSSNTPPNGTSRTGAAFVTYLDALSSGIAPSPPSAKAVAGYLDDLTSTGSDGSVGTRVVDIEGRLSKLETSISSLPDDIASRIISWQNSQDKKMSEELEKIKKMLEDVKS
jgi:hypothetical protein